MTYCSSPRAPDRPQSEGLLLESRAQVTRRGIVRDISSVNHRGGVFATLASAALVISAFTGAGPASAHHTSCYFENRNPSPYGSYDKYAAGSKAMQFYVPVEGGGVRGTRVRFYPELHGHAHSCLAWEATNFASMQAAPHGEWLYLSTQYWNSSTRQWVVAGTTWLNNQYRTQSKRWKLDYASPKTFTHARVVAWWYKDGVYSNSRSMTCTLGSHGQSSYSCS